MTREADRNGLPEPLIDNAHLPTTPLVMRQHALPVAKHAQKTEDWNTSDLPWRITSDLTAAACSSILVSPLITMIDRGIIERASTRCRLRTSLSNSLTQLATRPHTFVTSRPFLLISTLYFGTYLTANTVDTLTSTLKDKPPEMTTSGPPKFLATTAVNMSLCLYKDSQFARIFGPQPASIAGTAARKIPAASYALFALRDSLTIFASFNLPPLITPILPLSKEMEKQVSRSSAAQFLAPAAMQLLSTPLHLWGLDLYNRPTGNGVGVSARVKRVGRDWLGSSAARMGRIVPAFGVGGVVNSGVRTGMMKMRELE